MAPSFDHLVEENLDDEEFDEDEVDISDLKAKYEVQLESGLDTFVVVDGLPTVDEAQKPKLVKFLLKKLNSVGKTREDQIYMPMGEDGKSMKYVAREIDPCREREGRYVADSGGTASPLSSIPRKPRPPPLCGGLTASLSTRGTPSVSTS